MPKCILQTKECPNDEKTEEICSIIMDAMNVYGTSDISLENISLVWVKLIYGKPWLTIHSRDKVSPIAKMGDYIKGQLGYHGYFPMNQNESHVEIRFDMTKEHNYI